MGLVYSLWDRFVILPLEGWGLLTPREEKPRVIFRRRNFRPESSSDSEDGGLQYIPPHQGNPNPYPNQNNPRQATPPVQPAQANPSRQARRVKERRHHEHPRQ